MIDPSSLANRFSQAVDGARAGGLLTQGRADALLQSLRAGTVSEADLREAKGLIRDPGLLGSFVTAEGIFNLLLALPFKLPQVMIEIVDGKTLREDAKNKHLRPGEDLANLSASRRDEITDALADRGSGNREVVRHHLFGERLNPAAAAILTSVRLFLAPFAVLGRIYDRAEMTVRKNETAAELASAIGALISARSTSGPTQPGGRE